MNSMNNNNWLGFSLSPHDHNHHHTDVDSSTTTTAVDVSGEYCFDLAAASDESSAVQTSVPSPFGIVLDAFTRDNNSHSRGFSFRIIYLFYLFLLIFPFFQCIEQRARLTHARSPIFGLFIDDFISFEFFYECVLCFVHSI